LAQLAVSLDLEGLDAETVEDACFAAGALSISYTDRRDDPILEPAPGEFRLWPATRMQALFPAELAAPRLLADLGARLGLDASRFELQSVADRSWEREWLRDFHAIRCGSRLWICPSHAEVTEPGAVVVQLDPGLAFGTGTHPTTRLCLEWLDAQSRPATRVIDYGCGSGILAIAALKLGARAADAFDIDPQALIATRDNARANAVYERLCIHESAAALAPGADLLLANILSGPLCELGPVFRGLLAPGGQLVLAGLLDEQADEVIRAYEPWIALRRWASRDGWTCLSGQRE
jgi:ribosomal protein L11 methyltransferase